MSTTFFEEENRAILRKPDFLFGDAAPDTDQQLLAGEGQWIYTLNGDRYYLPKTIATILWPFSVGHGAEVDEMGISRSTYQCM